MSDETMDIGDLAKRMIEGTPQTVAMGFQFISAGDGVGTIKVPYREDLVGDPETGVIAGGVVTTLLDHVCGLSIRAASSAHSAMATLDLRIDYMRAAKPRRDVIGRAHCYKATHTVAFVRAVAYEDDPEDPIATAQGAFMLTGAPSSEAPAGSEAG
ncbi:MAG: PaaI family thioesterase [Caulobacterales bacterium]